MDQPEAPDPAETATAQFGANVGAGAAGSIINNYNENNPYAKVKYKTTGYDKVQAPDGSWIKVPHYKKVTKLKPAQQTMLDQQNEMGIKMNDLASGQIDKLTGIMSDPVNFDNAPGVDDLNLQNSYGNFNYDTTFGDTSTDVQTSIDPTTGQIVYNRQPGQGSIAHGFGDTQEGVNYDFGVNDWSADRKRVEDSIMSRYDDLEKDNISNLDARLASQGIDPRNEAARREFYDIDKRRTDAEMQAIQAGGAEQSRLQGLKTQAGMAKNAAQNQEFGQRMARGQFQNAAEAQEWEQLMGEAQFQNEAQQQEFMQALQSGQFANAAQAQEFLQAQARGQFGQMGTQMNEGAARNAAAFSNNAAAQKQAAQIAARNRYIQELLTKRQIPINEISALMGGGQVTLPSFPNPYQQPMGAPDYEGQVANNYNQQMQYAGQMNSALMSGLFGLAGNIL